jgi:uncharacterized protein (UPF0332 family)
MNDDHLLQLNVQQVLKCLKPVLSNAEFDKVRDEVKSNVRQLLRLGEAHLRAARLATGNGAWRQKVSRGYYACYATSRAVRLCVLGFYNTSSDDHKKIGKLPEDFPRKGIWENRLTQFRGDRNLADYDHTVTAQALENPGEEYVRLASEFIVVAKKYLRDRGNL